MDQLQDIISRLPRTLLVLVVLVLAGLLMRWRARSASQHSKGTNEGIFVPRVLIVIAFAVLAFFSFGIAFTIFDVVVTPVCLLLGAFVGFAALVLSRSRVVVTQDEIEYFDGWRRRLCFPREEIVSVKIIHPGVILVVQCSNPEHNFTVPLLAYSRAGSLVGLLQRSAMRL